VSLQAVSFGVIVAIAVSYAAWDGVRKYREEVKYGWRRRFFGQLLGIGPKKVKPPEEVRLTLKAKWEEIPGYPDYKAFIDRLFFIRQGVDGYKLRVELVQAEPDSRQVRRYARRLANKGWQSDGEVEGVHHFQEGEWRLTVTTGRQCEVVIELWYEQGTYGTELQHL
jgi:hypothetical protein